MIHQNYKKHLFYPAFTVVLAVVVLAVSNFIVRAQRMADLKSSPLKFSRLSEPKKEVVNNTLLPTTAGDLDPTFSVDGKNTTDFSSRQNANAIAIQTDGKIVAAGAVTAVGSSGSTNYDFAVFRYNPDGSLDTSFDADGKVTTPIGNGNVSDAAYAVAVQTDGKIVVAGGEGGGGAALVRYNMDGSLDTSFGVGGKVTNVGVGAILEIVIQTDGKIVAACGGFTIARYNENGSLDASFSDDGIVTTDFGNQYQSVYSVAVQADGKIVAAGDTGFCDDDFCYFDFALARYSTDGSPDTSFDADGKLTTTFGVDYESAVAVVVQTDGKIVAAGDAGGFAVSRYNGDGSLDPTFDGDGKVTTGFGTSASSAVLQSDGKIVVSGYALGAIYDFALARLNTDGSLDTSFDGDGTLTTDFGVSLEQAFDVAIQADGRIVAAGYSSDFYIDGNGRPDFALSRYNADGSLDAAFDADGKVTTQFLVVSSAANAIAIDHGRGDAFFAGYSSDGTNDDFAIVKRDRFSNEKIRITPIGNLDERANAVVVSPFPLERVVVAGYSDSGSNSDFALVRYHPFNLDIDTSFGQNGKVTTDFGGDDSATAIALLPDYSIFVVGHTNGGAALALARYHFDGSLNTSFGTGGKVIVQGIQNAKAMAIQPDGKIIAAGSAPHTEPPFGDNFALARFHPDGSLDTSFDGDGIAVTRFDHISQVNSVALQSNGNIVAAGFTRNNAGTLTEFALARLLANGSLDTSFDTDGKVTTSFNTALSAANAVSIQRNRKIVAVGVIMHDHLVRDVALARYNPNGSLDTTFDMDGKQTTDFFGDDDDAFAAAIQRDGRILTAGSARRGAKFDFAAARYIGDTAQTEVKYDYDGDSRADISVFRESDSTWYLNRSTDGFSAMQFGLSTDKIAPADFDGDGEADIAVYRPESGIWYWLNSSTGAFNAVQFGLAGDLPTPADYDGDEQADISVFRPSNGFWYRLNSSNGSFYAAQFGASEDKPTVGDFDGDGKADLAVWRPSNGAWQRFNSSNGQFVAVGFGLSDDLITPADFDGDGATDIAVYRPSTGTWYSLNSSNGALVATQFGSAEDQPTAADFDGDGRADISVFRPSNGVWYRLNSGNGSFFAAQFGVTGDRPTPAAFRY